MTYQELQESLLKWLNREGFTDLADMSEEFIALAENMIARECDLNAMNKVANLSTATTTVPEDWLRAIAFTIIQGDQNYEVNGAPIKKVMQAGQGGRPLYYAVVGDDFFYGPTPDQEYSFQVQYYGKIPALSATNETNWTSDNYPELILWGAMVAACLFLKDDARLQVWEARFKDVKNSLLLSEEQRDREGGSLAVREQQTRYLGSTRSY